MSNLDDQRLMAKIATLYYEADLTQQEICELLGLSRPKVSRLLSRARREGIVQITIHFPSGVFPRLEHQLEQRYGLREAIVVEVPEPDSPAAVRRALAGAAANYLVRVIQPGDIVGITWGRTLAQVVQHLPPSPIPDVTVVQATGGLGEPTREAHASGVAARMAAAFKARLLLLPAPGIVDTAEARAVLLQDSHVRAALDALRNASVLVMGIGVPERDSVLVEAGSILEWSELQDLTQKGCVGDVALHFFDSYGRPVPCEISSRTITVDAETIAKIPRTLGVAGGAAKIPAIRAALRGRWINTLVTDQATARALLREEEESELDGNVADSR